MAIREIVKTPDPVLRRKAHKITTFDKDLQVLIDDMIETMREAPGVGLAAPQIGISERLIVIEYGDDEDENVPKKLYVLINPEIIEASEEKVEGIEACLSVPQLVGEVERHEKMVVKSLTATGNPSRSKSTAGWRASSSTKSTTWMACCLPTGPHASGARKKTKPSKTKFRSPLDSHVPDPLCSPTPRTPMYLTRFTHQLPRIHPPGYGNSQADIAVGGG